MAQLSNGTVQFEPSVFPGAPTITLNAADGPVVIAGALTLDGATPGGKFTLSGGGATQLFVVQPRHTHTAECGDRQRQFVSRRRPA